MRTPQRNSNSSSSNSNNHSSNSGNAWMNDSMFVSQQPQPTAWTSASTPLGSTGTCSPSLNGQAAQDDAGNACARSSSSPLQNGAGVAAAAAIEAENDAAAATELNQQQQQQQNDAPFTPLRTNTSQATAMSPLPMMPPTPDYDKFQTNSHTNMNHHHKSNGLHDEDDDDDDDDDEMQSLLLDTTCTTTNTSNSNKKLFPRTNTNGSSSTPIQDNSSHHRRSSSAFQSLHSQLTSRHAHNNSSNYHHRKHAKHDRRKRRKRTKSVQFDQPSSDLPYFWRFCCFCCICCWRRISSCTANNGQRCCDQTVVRSTLSVMNILAKMVLWCSIMALCVAVVWYSYELKNNGTDPHLIAWFSAGAFVILGFPISMYGIISHLANYNQPSVQCYVVRILWMVPIYSIESWLCLRFHRYAIYIETLRDLYESYVLYSFLQFLIEVLGGEEALILMLKDKSPTRGVHMWGLQWFVKPWLMGQPVRKTYQQPAGLGNNGVSVSTTPKATSVAAAAIATTTTIATTIHDPTAVASSNATTVSTSSVSQAGGRALKRVHWKSPFFVYCKFGVLQYVLLKFVCSIVVMVLERNGIYKEGDFTPKGGYLYICILTNLSQCWALYCLIFFYYATKTELGSIRPVGKFLSVKALVFFTWWQSVCISMLYQMDLIPHYRSSSFGGTGGGGYTDEDGTTNTFLTPSDFDVTSGTISEHAALAFDQHGGKAIGEGPTEWTSEDVAKGMQDYLICIEMFIAAIVHTFVFPHLEYSVEAVEARSNALNQTPHKHWNKRLGRKWKEYDSKSAYSYETRSTMSDRQHRPQHILPLLSTETSLHYHPDELEMSPRHRCNSIEEDDYLMQHPMEQMEEARKTEQDAKLARNPLPTFDDSMNSEGDNSVSIASSTLHSDDNDDDDDRSYSGSESSSKNDMEDISLEMPVAQKPNFVRALLDSTIPQDLRDNTVGIIKGDYIVERKTLLHHAATSDSYDLFSRVTTPKPPSSQSSSRK